MVELWGDIGFLIFTLSSTAFSVLYLTMSRWYKSFVGTIVAIFSVCVVILSAYISLRIWGFEPAGVEWLRLSIFWVLGITMTSLLIGFIKIQLGARSKLLKHRLSSHYDDVKK